ncbi:MAG: hypothetical protein U0790_11120 [Isosphaeraceae bacterium]
MAELKRRLEPFYVLKSKLDWDQLQHIWGYLDEVLRARLSYEVNELLFLWMVGVEGSLREGLRPGRRRPGRPPTRPGSMPPWKSATARSSSPSRRSPGSRSAG